MTVSAYATGTQTATVGTEHTLSSGDLNGRWQLVVDLSNMADGDVVEFRAYQKVLSGGTERVVDIMRFYGAQPTDALIYNSAIVNNELESGSNNTKFTLKQTFGTGRNFDWKLLNLDYDYGLVDKFWDEAYASHSTGGTFGKLAQDTKTNAQNADTQTTAAAIRSAVGLAVANLDTQFSNIAANVWNRLTSALTTVGSIGKLLADNINASLADINLNVSGVAADVWGYASRSLSVPVDINTGQLTVKKNTALNNFEFLMKQSGDHITPATGLTVTAERSIDGGAFAACANTVSEVGSGVYKINLAAADLNGNVITLKFTATGADQRTITILTQA